MSHAEEINRVIKFWFSLPTNEWFSNKHDKYIIENFSGLVEKARLTSELDQPWTTTPSGSLALILLLDQFTRNIFRVGNSPEPGLSWSGDTKAFNIASTAVARGFDMKVQEEYRTHENRGYSHRSFFYLPFMHAENMGAQIASCALAEKMALELEIKRLQGLTEGRMETDKEKQFREQINYGVTFAIRHRDTIAALGRFPARNEPLGRVSTSEEKRWLEDRPEGF